MQKWRLLRERVLCWASVPMAQRPKPPGGICSQSHGVEPGHSPPVGTLFRSKRALMTNPNQSGMNKDGTIFAERLETPGRLTAGVVTPGSRAWLCSAVRFSGAFVQPEHLWLDSGYLLSLYQPLSWAGEGVGPLPTQPDPVKSCSGLSQGRALRLLSEVGAPRSRLRQVA